MAADPLPEVQVGLAKDASVATAGPNDNFTYDFQVTCSATEGACVDLVISDQIPAPFELVGVDDTSGGAADAADADITLVGNTFTVTFTDDLQDDGNNVGMLPEHYFSFSARVHVPATVSASYNQVSVTNTAFVSTASPNSGDTEDSAVVELVVPLVPGSTVGKTFTPSSMSATAGSPLAMGLSASNTTNASVETLTIEDPASTAFNYVAVTGATVTFPDGAATVRTDWFDGTDWHEDGVAETSIVLPADPAAIHGLRFTFFSSGSGIAVGAVASVNVAGVLRDSVAAITGTVPASNTATSWVTVAGAVQDVHPSKTAVLTLKEVRITPTLTKVITPSSVLGGDSVTVTLRASNAGDFSYKSMTITEPSAGSPTLLDQGLLFSGFVDDDIEWPIGATGATIRYLYQDEADYDSALPATPGSLPAPDPDKAVEGFQIVFTGTITTSEYAVVPFRAATAQVAEDVTMPNTSALEVTTTADLVDSATAQDDLTRRSARVNTEITKIASPSTIYSAAGSSSVVTLRGEVSKRPTSPTDTGGSTVGATSLVVTDTADPETDPFWEYFDLAAIVATSVQDGVTLNVDYWDGDSWEDFGAPVVGPSPYSHTLNSTERQNVGGIRFTFTPTVEGELLPPGTTVQPNLRVVLRDTQRSHPDTPAANPDAAAIVTVDNRAKSEASSDTAIITHVEAFDAVTYSLLPIPGGSGGTGGGIPLLDKQWDTVGDSGLKYVNSRSSDQATLRLNWGTGGLQFSNVEISDPSEPLTPVAGTVFEAFDLVSIPEITPEMDPLLTFDQVSDVELFIGGQWVSAGACAITACDGTFGGYVLTDSQRENATGVRLVFEESPTRIDRIAGDPLAPPVGSGVADTINRVRQIELVFEVRDVRRSDPATPVLGISRGAVYNAGSGDGNKGRVINTATAVGTPVTGDPRTSTAWDTIAILDTPLAADAVKTWVGGPFGTPPVGTPAELYPAARMSVTAKNSSQAAWVDTLRLIEPSVGISPNPFNYVNITDIVSISVPVGAAVSVTLLPAGTVLTVDAAEALDRAALADVAGVVITATGRIEPGQSITMVADTQLRQTVRGSSDDIRDLALPIDVVNDVTAIVLDPGGSQVPPDGETLNEIPDTDDATITIDELTYGVEGTKEIEASTNSLGSTPAIQYDDTTSATIVLSGRPTGNVRSTRMVFEDVDPSFWNAFDFSGFGALDFENPINRVQVDALVGVDYVLGGSNSISAQCNEPDHDCWVTGSSLDHFELPPGVLKADVRGLRFTFTRDDYAAWERPSNPEQIVRIVVERREKFVNPSTELVPSTLFTFTTPAPGETSVGTFTNDMTVTTAAARDADDTHPLWTATVGDSSSITVAHLPARVLVTKSQYGPRALGVDIPFDITVKNLGEDRGNGDHDSALTQLTVVENIPTLPGGQPMLVIPDDPDTGAPPLVENAFTYSLVSPGGVAQAVTNVTATGNANSTQFTFAYQGTLELGWSLVVHATLRFRPLLTANTNATNTVSVTALQPFDLCRSSTNETNFSETTDVLECGAQTTVYPLPSSPLSITKSVRGVGAGTLDGDGNPSSDDLGVLRTTGTANCEVTTLTVPGLNDVFYRYPCVPITRPGSTEEWGTRLYNGGNIDVKKIVAIDVLPRTNDRGVIIDTARGSKWTAVLTSYPQVTNIPAGWDYEVYYTDTTTVATTRCNATDIQHTMGVPDTDSSINNLACLDPADPDYIGDRDWKVLQDDTAMLATVVAFKIVIFAPTGVTQALEPGTAVGVVYRTVTADAVDIPECSPNAPIAGCTTGADNMYRDSVAYNSIAAAAVGTLDNNDLPYRFVVEPRKVGVALAMGQFEITKNVTGASASHAPGTFDFTVECRSADGDLLDLKYLTGADRSPYTVAANSTLLVQGIPLYSECTVSEALDYGQTDTVAPQTVVAQAAQDANPGSKVVLEHPAFGSRPDTQTAAFTNRYASTTLTVTKSIATNGALDKDGHAITYKDALVSVLCTFNNGVSTVTVLDVENQPVSPGSDLSYPGLPVRSLCTVTETDQRGATTTSVVTTGAGAVSGGGASPAQFALTEGADSVAFANDFGAGSVRVTKVVAGAASAEAWAAGPFTVQVTCTNPNTVATTVYSKSIVLSRSDTVYLIDHLPTGSSCVTTEPERNGATSTTLPGTITVDRGEQAAVVTNTFNYARLLVKKLVATTAVDGSDVGVLPGPFDFSVLCTFTYGTTAVPVTDTVLTATFSLVHNGTKEFTGMPAGTACTVTESTPVGSPTTSITTTTSAGANTYNNTLTATINSLTSDASSTVGTNSAVVTNSYPVGSLVITKALKGGARTQFGGSQVFTFLVTCTSPGVTGTYTRTVQRTGAGDITVSRILAGSTCSVSESNAATTGADAVVILDGSGAVISGTGLAIGSGPTAVTFQNWYLTGQVTVTKTVNGPGAAFGTGPFTVHLVCTREGKSITISGGADRSLTNGTSTTYTLLPRGASCTLTETNTYGAGSTVITNSTFVVVVDNSKLVDNQVQPAISVTNTFQLADLVVSKQVVSGARNQDGTLITYGAFDMQVTCTFQTRPVRATGFSSDTMTFTLIDGATRTLSGLPAGAICEVQETNAHGAARTSITTVSGGAAPSLVSGKKASVTLVTGATNSAAVKNEYDSGSLTLSKVVGGLAGPQYGGGTFTVLVECVLADGASSQVVWRKSYELTGASAPISLSPLATGAVCTVTETGVVGATSTSVTVDGTTTPGTSAPATVPAGSATTVVVTNTFDYAGLVVSKTVKSDAVDAEGEPVYPGGTFDIEVVCTFLGSTVLATGYTVSPMAFPLGHDESEELTGLPAGAECVVAEVTTVQADSTTIETKTASQAPKLDGNPATITSLTSDNTSGATNSAAITNSYGVTSFTVEKVLKGGASAQFGVGPFNIHVVCTAPGNVPAYDATIVLPSNGSWFRTIPVPVGSVCTTDESNFDATGADAQATVDADGDPVTSTTVTLAQPGHVFIENWYLTGAVDVTKLVTGTGGEKFGTGTFTVDIECWVGTTRAILPDDSEDFVDHETVTFTGLPSGADCTLTETDKAGAHTSRIVVASSGAALADDSFTVVVTRSTLTDDQEQPALRVENDFPVTSLVITKNVVTDAVDDQGEPIEYGPFPVSVTCTLNGAPVTANEPHDTSPMTADLVNGEPWTLEDLPVGARCAIVETDDLDAVATSITAVSGVDVENFTGTSADITLPEASTAVEISNSYDVGSVTLSKRVWGDGRDAWGTEAFTVALVCTLTDASGTRTVFTGSHVFHKGDAPFTVENIAYGAICVVTETKTGAATATAITVGTGEPTDGTSAEFTLDGDMEVEVANRFDTTSVDVTKERIGDGKTLWGAGPFEVTLVCERDVDGTDQQLTIPGGATRPLEAPDYVASFDELPVGADCVAAETRFGGANGASVSPQVFTLVADPTAVTVTNEFHEGDLTVVKQVTGDGVGVDLWGSGPFEVSLECTRVVNGDTVTIAIPDGPTRPISQDTLYAATYHHLPEGADCVVTETVTGDATSTVVDPGTITILGNETVTVTVTNTFTIGQLQIVKTASQPVVQGATEFDYTFDVSNTGTVPAAGVTVVDEIPELLRVIGVGSDGWTDCAVADTDTFGYGGVLTCIYDKTLPAGASATPITITVAVQPDIAVDTIDNVAAVTSTTRGVTGDDDDEQVLVKWLDVTAASECVLEAPWFTYAMDVHNLDTSGQTLTATWRDGSGTVIRTDEIPLDGGPVEGRLLWPGASVNVDGVGIGWPGWRAALPGETPEYENLVLDPTLPQYGLTSHTEVTLSINPTATVTVDYPTMDDCRVQRDPGLWVKKVASAPVIAAGDTFDYALTVGNDGLGAVQGLALVDTVPATLRVLGVKPAAASSAEVPAWESCKVTDRLPNGYGGTVTCLLDRPLGYLETVPVVTLHVQLDPSAPVGSITNVAKVTAISSMGELALSAEDSAVIMTPGMLALTGLVVGGSVLPIGLGLLALGGVLIVLRFTPRRRRHRQAQ